jgi:hypothetical protein
MEEIIDPLLNPYYFASEAGDTALDPNEIQALRNKKRKHEAKRNLRHNVPQ